MVPEERSKSGALMRVDHSGEVCAQALYSGQALTARDPAKREALLQAAREEGDHLAWTRDRLRELGAHQSFLNPLWYAGSFTLGAVAGLAGDRWSLGWRELGNGLLGGATKGFIDQVKDGLVTDVLGGLLDKGLTVATMGAIKAPLIGPALTLFQSGLVTDALSGHLTDGKFAQGLGKQKDAIAGSAKAMGSNFSKAWNGDGGRAQTAAPACCTWRS
jgi:hypothetical protein